MRFQICFYCLAILTTICCSKEKDESISTTTSEIASLQHRIVNRNDVSYSNVKRMTYRVVLDVEAIPDKEKMKDTSVYIWEKEGKKWDEFTVFMYLAETDVEAPAYYAAEFRPYGFVSASMNDFSLHGTKWEPELLKSKKKPVSDNDIKQEALIKEYYVKPSIKRIRGKMYRLVAKTNFPDGTKLLVTAHRPYHEKNSSREQSGHIYLKSIPVQKGGIRARIKIDDRKWRMEYKEKQKRDPNNFPGISNVSGHVEFGITFSPKHDQSDEVLKVLGKDGEYVRGKGIEELAGYKMLSIEKKLKIPVRR